MKVLIVDDESDILEIYESVLLKEKCEVFKAQSGLQALEILKKHTFEIIISDINMPEMNGLDLLLEVRKTNKDIKFFVCSGYNSPSYILKSWEYGATRFYEKPITTKEIASIIHLAKDIIKEESVKSKNLVEISDEAFKLLNTDYEIISKTKNITKKEFASKVILDFSQSFHGKKNAA